MRYLRLGLALALGLAAPAHADDSGTHLNRLTQKLKKDCEDQGGQFVLDSATAKHTGANPDPRVVGHPADAAHGLVGQPGLSGNGQTAFQASGECTWTMQIPMTPPPDVPKPTAPSPSDASAGQ